MHHVSANYTLPTVLKTLQPAAESGVKRAVNAKASAAPTTGTNAGDTSASGIGSTFLNLLATELQNQDPTAPVDSTAMVGQMISLNQLDQLISINQTVTGSTGSTGSGSTGLLQPAGAAAGNAPLSSAIGGAMNPLSPSVAGAVANQLPFDPNTMMPLNPAIAGAPINSSMNPVSLGSSSTSNNTSGGK
jgi:flagellar basal-body rod modification protein FlgD